VCDQVLVSHVSHIAEDAHSAPGKALGDGALHVLVLRRPISRLRLLNLFLQFEEGKHVTEPEVRGSSLFRDGEASSCPYYRTV
jgi:diacylglycerol kinase family enzyme